LAQPQSSTPPDVDTLVTAVLAASRVLVGLSARSVAEIDDHVTLPQFRALALLDSHGSTTLRGLANALAVTPPAAARMIDRLVAARLVSRRDDPDNRRQVVLDLTPEGRRLVHEVAANRRGEIARIVRAMPSAQRSGLVTTLQAFADAAGTPAGEESGW
jgi:DNA-binding MarR family transcriptional regulator